MDRHLIKQDATILEALDKLNRLSGSAMTLIVTDSSGIMTGTVTDGDIRRSLISGHGLEEKVSEVMNREFKAIHPGQFDATSFHSFRNMGIRLLPVLDGNGIPVRLLDLNKIRSMLPLSALIMAGGKGERLRPLTLTTPKPLLEIDGKAIIDYNVEALVSHGIDNITVSTRYLSEQIIDHFSHPVAGTEVKCIVEDRQLGTIGALSLVDVPFGNIIVMNSDLLTTIAFDEMYIKHISEQAAITVAAIPYSVSVPYAILATDGASVTAIEEKPTYSYYANAGIYIVSSKAAALIKAGESIDATDLIDRAIPQNMKVAYFPLNGTWIDVGSPADFAHAAEIMRYHNSTTN